MGSVADRIHALTPAAKNVKILTIDVERQRGKWEIEGWEPVYKRAWFPMETMVRRPRIMCFAAKWYSSDEVIFHDERGTNGRGTGGHRRMVQAMWDLLDTADAVVTYNGDKADFPWMHEEFMHAGLPRPMPFKSIDLIKVNRKRFALPYRSLRYLSRELGTSGKLEHEGPDLWDLCLAGDEDGWAQMEAYNRQDVIATEETWLRLLPWLDGAAHMGILIGDDEQRRCPNCGSVNLTRQRKPARAHVREYESFRCDDCGTPVRSNILVGKPQYTRPIR